MYVPYSEPFPYVKGMPTVIRVTVHELDAQDRPNRSKQVRYWACSDGFYRPMMMICVSRDYPPITRTIAPIARLLIQSAHLKNSSLRK